MYESSAGREEDICWSIYARAFWQTMRIWLFSIVSLLDTQNHRSSMFVYINLSKYYRFKFCMNIVNSYIEKNVLILFLPIPLHRDNDNGITLTFPMVPRLAPDVNHSYKGTILDPDQGQGYAAGQHPDQDNDRIATGH